MRRRIQPKTQSKLMKYVLIKARPDSNPSGPVGSHRVPSGPIGSRQVWAQISSCSKTFGVIGPKCHPRPFRIRRWKKKKTSALLSALFSGFRKSSLVSQVGEIVDWCFGLMAPSPRAGIWLLWNKSQQSTIFLQNHRLFYLKFHSERMHLFVFLGTIVDQWVSFSGCLQMLWIIVFPAQVLVLCCMIMRLLDQLSFSRFTYWILIVVITVPLRKYVPVFVPVNLRCVAFKLSVTHQQTLCDHQRPDWCLSAANLLCCFSSQ